MTYDEFNDWIIMSKPGDKVIYHEGYLVNDRIDEDIGVLANAALVAAGYAKFANGREGISTWRTDAKKLVNLCQHRDDVNKYRYEAQRV